MSQKNTPPEYALEDLNVALRESRMLRGKWLMMLDAGDITTLQLFEAAGATPESPLRAIRLKRVLRTVGYSEPRVKKIVNRIFERELEMTGIDAREGFRAGKRLMSPTVGWLVDGRTHDRRIGIWLLEAEADRRSPIVDGFPWTNMT